MVRLFLLIQRWRLTVLVFLLPVWVAAAVPDDPVSDHWLAGSTPVWLADEDGDGIADEQDLCPNTSAGTPVNAYGCPRTLVACDYSSPSITLTSTGSGADGTLRYVLADSTGTILQVNTSPTFAKLTGTHTYMALAISYAGTVTGLVAGQSLSAVSASCYDWSDALPVRVCVAADEDGDGITDANDLCPNTTAGTPVNAYGCPQNLTYCAYTTPYFTLNTTRGSGNGTERYVLADSVGTILQVSSTASFSGLSGSHTYMVVAIIHDGSATGLTPGQTLKGVTANCYNWSEAVMVKVCVAADSDGDGVTDALDRCPGTSAGTTVNAYGCPTNVTSCDYKGASVTLVSSGGSLGSSVRYVLTDSVGKILQLSLVPSFSGLTSSHTYMALAITYDGPATNLVPGLSLSMVVASCYAWSDAVVFKVCPDTDGDGIDDRNDWCPNTPPGTPVNAYGCPKSQANCDYTTASVTLSSVGGTPGSSVRYVLADSLGTILQVNATPSFNGLSGSHTYMAVALTYNESAVHLTSGQALSAVTANCFDWSDAIVFKTCVSSTTLCDYTIGATITIPPTPGGSFYVLVDPVGVITQIRSSPSFPTTGLVDGTYNVYAMVCAADGSTGTIQVGHLWDTAQSTCQPISMPVRIKLCSPCLSKCIPVAITRIRRQ